LKLSLAGLEGAHAEAIRRLERERAVERIWSGDASLWKSDETHRKIIDHALGWLTIADRMQPEAAELRAFAEDASRGTDHVVVLGMGGSSLAPLVFALSFPRRAGRPALEVLDSTEPSSVADVARRCDPRRTLFIVSSKSGTTLEPNIFFDYFYEEARRVLPKGAGERFLVVTDPGSALEREARGRGVRRIFPGDPAIGGRYSALSHFGMVPAAFLGVDLEELLSRARRMAERCRTPDPSSNPGASLGAAIAAGALDGRDKLTFSTGAPVDRLGLWIEQLIAESTGKEGKGILPVEGEALGPPDCYGRDRCFVRIGPDASEGGPGELRDLEAAGHPIVRIPISDPLDLGAEMFRWEFATAVAGALLGIDAFDQPNVQEAKDRTNEILAGKARPPSGERRHQANLREHLDSLSPGDYFAITAYVPSTPENEAALNGTRLRVRDAKRVATTVGFGPRFLHSTGQFHKGGPPTGVFFQIASVAAADVPIPGKPWGFAEVVAAQAAGDLAALESRGRRVLGARIQADVRGGLATIDAAVAQALSATA